MSGRRPLPTERIRQDKTETNIAAAEIRDTATPIGRSAATSAIAPTAAPIDPKRAEGGAHRMVHRFEGILAVPVEAPLTHIAVHVQKPPGVGLSSAHGMGPLLGIELIPGHRIDRSVELSGFAHATGVFPLSLRGQVPAPTSRNMPHLMVELRQLARELPSVVPTDLLHRQMSTPKLAGVMRHEQRPLTLGARSF